MPVVAIKGIPKDWELGRLVKHIAHCIRRKFEGLGFSNSTGNTKTGYIRLPSGSKASAAVNMIHSKKFRFNNKTYTFQASPAKNVPKFKNKPQQLSNKMKKHLRIPFQKPPSEDIMTTHDELFIEIQSVYTELYTLSMNTNHRLLKNISKIIFERLLKLSKTQFTSAFEFSKVYRRSHPHHTDVPLIVSTLHSIQDADGVPRTQLTQNDLIKVQHHLQIKKQITMPEAETILQKYSERFMIKVRDYLATVKDELDINFWGEEDAPSKRVKEAIVKMPIEIESIVEDVLFTHYKPRAFKYNKSVKMMMYGIPYLPSKEARIPILHPHGVSRKARGDLYNLMLFTIPKMKYDEIMQFQGRVIEGALLHIRHRDAPFYKLPEKTVQKMKHLLKNLL